MMSTTEPKAALVKTPHRILKVCGAACATLLAFLVYAQNFLGVVPEYFFSTHRDGSEALVLGKILADREGLPTPKANLGYFVMGDQEKGGDVLRVYDLVKGLDLVTPFDYTDENWNHGIAKNWDGFFVLTSANSVIGYKPDAFPLGARVLWIDGTQRLIERVAPGPEYINVFVSKPLAGVTMEKPRQTIQILDYNGGQIEPQFVPYASQFGLQGIAYSLVQRVFSFDTVAAYQNIAAGLLALCVVFLSFYLGKAVSPLLGVSFFLLSVLSPWVPSFARNLYWSPFLWYLPAVIVFLWHSQKTKRSWVFLPLLFTAFLIKFLAGYEYITVVMLFAASIFLVAPLPSAKGGTWKQSILNISIVLGIGLLAFLVSLVIHALSVADNLMTGLDIVRERAVSRTVGSLVEGGAGVAPNVGSVLVRYLFGWDIPVFSFTGQFTFAAMIVLALLVLGIRAYFRDLLWSRDAVVLGLMSLIPLSWFVLALNHSAVHTHMNFVLWYIGFMPFVLYLGLDGFRVIYLKVFPPRLGKRLDSEVLNETQSPTATNQAVSIEPPKTPTPKVSLRDTVYPLVSPAVFVMGMLILAVFAIQPNGKPSFTPHQLSDENWTNGVSRGSAAFFFRSDPKELNPIVAGDKFVFKGSGERTVTRVVQLGEWTNVYLNGAALDPQRDGYPNPARLERSQGAVSLSLPVVGILGMLILIAGFLVLTLLLWLTEDKSRGGILLVVLVFGLLVLPTVSTLLGFEPQVKVVENRPPARQPEFDLEKPEQFAGQYMKYYNDTFGFRNLLVKGLAWFKFQVFHSSPADTIIVGLQGMTFYHSDVAEGNHSIGNYRGTSRLDDTKIAAIWSVLGETAEALRARGIGFAFLITPDKPSIYPDRMPPQYTRLSERSLIDQITENSAVVERSNIIDLREPLKEARKVNDVYYDHGTHWNQFGALVGFLELGKKFRSAIPTIPEYSLEDFSLSETVGSTDSMLVWVGLQDEYKAKEVLVTGPLAPKPNRAPKVLFYGDSFYSWIEGYLSLSFEKVTYRRYGSPFQLDLNLIDAEKPSFVVLEITERFIEKSF